jgi:hypothetical protein
MPELLDFGAYNKNDELVLVVEAKSKPGSSPEWAAQLRRNILAHGVYANPKYFLLVVPDRFYLWNNGGTDRIGKKPTYIVDAGPSLKPYFEQAGVKPEQLDGRTFETIVFSWLSKVIHANGTPGNGASAEKWLIDSGLYTELAGGRLAREMVA